MAVWEETSPVFAWADWLDHLWKQYSARTPQLSKRLTEWQSLMVWQDIIQAQFPEFIRQTSSAELAWQAWQLMQNWRLGLDYVSHATQEVSIFLQWAKGYHDRLNENGWVDACTFVFPLMEALTELSDCLPERIDFIGFDDWPPLQQWVCECLEKAGVRLHHEAPSLEAAQQIQAFSYADSESEWWASAIWAKGLIDAGVQEPIVIVVPQLSQHRARLEAIFSEVFHEPALFRVGEKRNRGFNLSGGIPLSRVPLVEEALLCLESLKLVPDDRPIQAWIDSVVDTLSQKGWPFERVVNSDAYQAIEHWHGVLKTLRIELGFLATINGARFYHYLSLFCQQCLFQPQSVHEQANVHVLGILEAAGMKWSYAWISGLSDGQWPQRPKPNPFIDCHTQVLNEMPHASSERERLFSQKILARLVGSSREVIGSSPLYEEGIAVSPSPLLNAFISGFSLQSSPIQGSALFAALKNSSAIEGVVDWQGLPLIEKEMRGGAALLRSQTVCPYQAYARYRWGLEPPRPISLGLPATIRGQWLHKALELFWRLESPTEGALMPCIREAEKTLSLGDFSASLWALERERLHGLLKAYWAAEKERDFFMVEAVEERVLLPIGPLTLRGRVDRLDREAGALCVVDYKTGKVSSSDWLGEVLKEPQLPLYAVSAYKEVKHILAIEIRPQGVVYHRLGEDNAESRAGCSWPELKARWHQQLSALAEDFGKGWARVSPLDQQTCEQCHLQSVCRRFEGVDHE